MYSDQTVVQTSPAKSPARALSSLTVRTLCVLALTNPLEHLSDFYNWRTLNGPCVISRLSILSVSDCRPYTKQSFLYYFLLCFSVKVTANCRSVHLYCNVTSLYQFKVNYNNKRWFWKVMRGFRDVYVHFNPSQSRCLSDSQFNSLVCSDLHHINTH